MSLENKIVTLAETIGADVRELNSDKVDKVTGKGLSDTNYTQAEKTKLAGIATGATKNRADTLNADKSHTHTTAQVTGLDTALGSKASSSDSRFTNAREWTGATISQAEAEAGTATTRRAFTSQRVRQAIVAWWNSITGTFGRDLVTSANNTDARSKLGLGTSALRWPTWAEVTSKPTSFTPSSHTHTWSQVTGQPATATRWPTFTEVTGKPIVQTMGSSTTDIMSQKAVTDAITYAEESIGQPIMTSNAVLDRADNSIVATGIVSKLGLEVGDVIEVDNDNLRSGFLKPLGQTVGQFFQFATKGNDVYIANYNHGSGFIMKQTNGEGLFEKIEGVPVGGWIGICFIGNQMYAAENNGYIYSVDEATGAVDIVDPTYQTWYDLTTDGTYIYGCMDNTGIIIKVNPITKTEEHVVPTSPYGDVRGLVYSPIDNSLYIGAGSGAQPIRKLVNMTGTWIDVSTEKRPWSSASYYNGKVYFSDHVGQVWKQNDAGDDFELFSTKPLGSPDAQGGNIIVNDMLYKGQIDGDIYTTSIIKKDLFTVESIVSSDKIIVNYAHAFGAGSKSLWSQTLSAAKFKRIAKWYNAPLGLGQAWVDLKSSRGVGTTYTNTTGRPIQALVTTITTDGYTNSLTMTVNIQGVVTTASGGGDGGASIKGASMSFIIPEGGTYSATASTWVETATWSELR